MESLQDNIDTDFDAGGKVSVGLTATTIVSQWIWAATLLQSSAVGSKVRNRVFVLRHNMHIILQHFKLLYDNP